MRHHKKTPTEIETPEMPKAYREPLSPLRDVRLPAYTGSKGLCSRCGQGDPNTTYFPAGATCRHAQGMGWFSSWGIERLHRTCSCGFTWDEACLAPVPPDPNPTLVDMPAVKD